MITNLKDIKAHLSAYVELAAGGEDVVITVHGKPKVRLCRVQTQPEAHELNAWGERLEEARARYKGSKKTVSKSDQGFWDALREDRL